MPRRSKRIKTATQSGGTFGNLPRSIVVHILKYFDIHEVARLQRLVCHEFRDAGQERIHEQGGRKLYDVGMAFLMGCDYQTIDKDRGWLLIDASREAGCQLYVLCDKMEKENLSNEEKKKIFKELKKIARTSPYHWVEYFIGTWYHNGFGGEEKKNQAVEWYSKAINGGNAAAMYSLAFSYMYANGGIRSGARALGLTKSATKANELYALAAEKGHAMARFNLACSYRDGTGVEIDFNRCVELLEQSAEQGYVHAQCNLADVYRDGSGDNENGNPMTIPKNDPLHFKWALAAAKQDHVDGQAYTAVCYEEGCGVEPNNESAFEWYMKAAEQEDEDAQYCVGRFFENGRGREIDLIQALFWYRKAATEGWQLAMDAVERLA